MRQGLVIFWLRRIGCYYDAGLFCFGWMCDALDGLSGWGGWREERG